jgi:uncharacterized protein (TIGR00369 family)
MRREGKRTTMSGNEKKPAVARDPNWEARVRDILARQPIVAAFAMEVEELSPGVCTLAINFKPELAQQHGFFHAGIVSTLADNAGGMAAASMMPPGSEVLAVEFKVNFLAPAKGERMSARAEVIKSGRTLTISQVTVSMSEGGRETVCALMQQTCMAVSQ